MVRRGKYRGCIVFMRHNQLKAVVNVTPTENFDFADALESVYPLLETVFSHLDYNSLQNCALVKPSWEIAAKKVLKKRNKFSWASIFAKSLNTCVSYGHNYCHNNAEVGIVLVNSRLVSLSDWLCCHESTICRKRKIKFSEFIGNEMVPEGVKYCVIACPGISSAFSQHTFAKSCIPLIDSCFIPAIPNVRISMFYCDPSNMSDDHIKANEEVKCLLLFCSSNLEDRIYTILEHLVPEHNNVAFGGGIVNSSKLFSPTAPHRSESRKLNNLCIAFMENSCCESTFSSSSVVINGNNLTKEYFEEQLLKFKKQITIRNNSLAFRICCSAARKTLEPYIFRKVFCDTPLISMDANGEIGWNFFNSSPDKADCDAPKPKKARLAYPIVHHQWSTVIVFMTWGNILNNQQQELSGKGNNTENVK